MQSTELAPPIAPPLPHAWIRPAEALRRANTPREHTRGVARDILGNTCGGPPLREPTRPPLSRYAGSQWFVVSKAFAEYVEPAAAVGWPKKMLEEAKKIPGKLAKKDNFATR